MLRREEKQDVPGWLWGAGYGVVGSLFLALFATVAAGYSFAGRRDGVRLPAWLVAGLPRRLVRFTGAGA